MLCYCSLHVGLNVLHSHHGTDNAVHARRAFLHLQFLRHMETALQPHFMSSLQATAAAGTVVQMGCHPVSDLYQPKSSGLGAAMTGFRLCPNTGLVHTSVDMLEQCILCWW